jgi:hypothetical protein
MARHGRYRAGLAARQGKLKRIGEALGFRSALSRRIIVLEYGYSAKHRGAVTFSRLTCARKWLNEVRRAIAPPDTRKRKRKKKPLGVKRFYQVAPVHGNPYCGNYYSDERPTPGKEAILSARLHLVRQRAEGVVEYRPGFITVGKLEFPFTHRSMHHCLEDVEEYIIGEDEKTASIGDTMAKHEDEEGQDDCNRLRQRYDAAVAAWKNFWEELKHPHGKVNSLVLARRMDWLPDAWRDLGDVELVLRIADRMRKEVESWQKEQLTNLTMPEALQETCRAMVLCVAAVENIPLQDVWASLGDDPPLGDFLEILGTRFQTAAATRKSEAAALVVKTAQTTPESLTAVLWAIYQSTPHREAIHDGPDAEAMAILLAKVPEAQAIFAMSEAGRGRIPAFRLDPEQNPI